LTKNEVVSTQKIVTKVVGWILDWDPGVNKKASDPGSVSATLATGTYFFCTGRSKAQEETFSHPESFKSMLVEVIPFLGYFLDPDPQHCFLR
jgi:hypothetical protein